MGVYSVLLPDSKILERVAGFESVVIVGCTVCANSSIAFDKNLTLARVVVDKVTGETTRQSVAVVEEAERLKRLLEEKGIEASVGIMPGPCALSAEREAADAELVNRWADAEAVLTLCCAGGTLGIEKLLAKRAKTISGMRTVGSSFSYTVLDEKKGLVYMDREKSKMIRVVKP